MTGNGGLKLCRGRLITTSNERPTSLSYIHIYFSPSTPTHIYAYYGISYGPLSDRIVKVAIGTGAALP